MLSLLLVFLQFFILLLLILLLEILFMILFFAYQDQVRAKWICLFTLFIISYYFTDCDSQFSSHIFNYDDTKLFNKMLSQWFPVSRVSFHSTLFSNHNIIYTQIKISWPCIYWCSHAVSAIMSLSCLLFIMSVFILK